MARRTSPLLSAVLVLVVIGLALTAIYATRPDPPRPLAPAPSPAPVHLRRLAPETRAVTARAFGEAGAARRAVLAPEQPGRVVWLAEAFEEGGGVEAGEVLLRLDPGPFELAAEEGRAAARAAEAELGLRRASAAASAAQRADYAAQEELAGRERGRVAQLVAAGDLAESLLDAADRDLAAARAARKQAEQRAEVDAAAVVAAEAALDRAAAALASALDAQERSVLRAPFAGELSAPRVEVGEVLAPGAPLAVLVDRAHLELRAPLPSEEADGVRPGMTAAVVVPALLGPGGAPLSLAGEVRAVDPVVSPASRTRTLLVTLPNPGLRVPAGAFAEARVELGGREALWIRPLEYRTDGGGAVAFVAVDGRAERRELRLGRPVLDAEDRAWHPVLAGLAPGELLVTDNLEVLGDGSPLRVLED
jgi:membrane fusion protein (multidrug efflux system)